MENLTPYAAAQVANRVFAAKDQNRKVTPQMMYGYAKNGTIASNYKTRAEKEKVYFDGDAFKAWLDKPASQQAGRVDFDELAKQFM
jgi:hypothetical protein